MKLIIDFLVNNYVWFLTISLILVFGLIGYLVDTKERIFPKENNDEKEAPNNNDETQEVQCEEESE